MRALVLGALLVQTLNAQVTDGFSDTATESDVAATPAPLLTDPNEHSDSLVDTGIDATIDAGAASLTDDVSGSQVTPGPLDYTSELVDYTSSLATDTADIIVSTIASEDLDAVPTPTDDASAFTTPDPNGGISFNGTDWIFPPDTTASMDSGTDDMNGLAGSTLSDDAVLDPGATGRTEDDGGLAAAGVSDGAGDVGATSTAVEFEFPYTTDYADVAAKTPPPVVYDGDGNAVVPDISDSATPTPDAAFAGLAASETPSEDLAGATSTSLPGDDPNINQNNNGDDRNNVSTTPTAGTESATPVAINVSPPLTTSGAADTSSQDYTDATSTAVYDGQDYNSSPDDSECPWWCLGGVNNNGGGYSGVYPSASSSASSGGDGIDYLDNGNDYAGNGAGSSDGNEFSTAYYPSLRRFFRRALRARQSDGFAAFNWPSASTATADSANYANYRSGCPASCYERSSSVDGYATTTTGTGPPVLTTRPFTSSGVSGSYPTIIGYDNSSTGVVPTGVTTSSACGFGFGAACSDTDTPSSPSASEPSDINTDTSGFLTMASPSSPPISYPASSPASANAYPFGVDFTGDTLAGVCPRTCNATYPTLNFCDITTSCTTTGGSKGRTYCACRAGYRASRWNAKDFTKQFHVPGQPFVYVPPGVVCDQVCGDTVCSDVLVRPLCQ